MRFRLALLPTALLLFASCTKQTHSARETFTQHHSDGRVKPSVHVTPVRDLCAAEMPWSLSEEFDASISSSLLKDGSLYVMPREVTETAMSKLDSPRLDSKLNNLIGLFAPAEFLVELELVRHDEKQITDQTKIPAHMQGESVKAINVEMRVRLFDLRLAKPKMLLQEIVSVEHLVDQNKTATNYYINALGTKGYAKTPLGIAHAKLAEDVAERIEHYVAIAKSRPNAE